MEFSKALCFGTCEGPRKMHAEVADPSCSRFEMGLQDLCRKRLDSCCFHDARAATYPFHRPFGDVLSEDVALHCLRPDIFALCAGVWNSDSVQQGRWCPGMSGVACPQVEMSNPMLSSIPAAKLDASQRFRSCLG